MLIALAALTATSARGTLVSTRPHRRTPGASGLHTPHRSYCHAGTRDAYRAGPRTSTNRTYADRTHPLSANEVGWRAGLAIRRQLEQRSMAQQQAAARSVRLQTDRMQPTRRPRWTAQAAYLPQPGDATGTPTATDRTTRMLGAATASVAMSHEPAEAGVAEQADMQTTEATLARAIASPQDGQEIADNASGPGDSTSNGTAPMGRLASPGAPRQSAPAAMDNAATENSVSESSRSQEIERPPATEATSVKAESELALLRMPRAGALSPLRGSLESLERQNARLDAEGLERIEDEADLAARIANRLLVPLPASAGLTVNAELLENHRYCRPWTARFLADLAKQHEAQFHKPFEVSSAVRTVEYQRRLMRTNGNAAPAEGDIVSPHLTGATIDIAKQGLSRSEMAWMRQRLLALQSAGKIDVEEEFRQACFHITVYKEYAPATASRPLVEAKSGRRQRRPTAIADSLAVSTPMQ